MPIDPLAWVATLPMTVFLVALWYQPSDNVLKRWWHELTRLEENVWMQLGCDTARASAVAKWERHAFWLIVALIGLGSVASFAAWLGIWPA